MSSSLALHGTGLRRIGELLALPAASIARRFGPDAALYLQRLRGTMPEPLRYVQAPPHFNSRCEFADAISDTTALLFPLQRLLAGLQGYLRARDRAVQRYTLRLEHHRGALTQPGDRVSRGPVAMPRSCWRWRASGSPRPCWPHPCTDSA